MIAGEGRVLDGVVGVVVTVVAVAALYGGLHWWSGRKVHEARLARLRPLLGPYAAMGLTTAPGMLDVASMRGVPRPPALGALPVRTPGVGVIDGARVAVFETFHALPGDRYSARHLPHVQRRIDVVAAFVDSPVTVPGDITFAGWFLGHAPPTLAVNPAVPGRMAAVAGRGWTSDDEVRRFVETLLTRDVRLWLDGLPRDVLTLSFSASSICGTLRWDRVQPPGSFDGPQLVGTLLQLRRLVPPALVAAYPLRPV